jgi:hypothetical protein
MTAIDLSVGVFAEVDSAVAWLDGDGVMEAVAGQ